MNSVRNIALTFIILNLLIPFTLTANQDTDETILEEAEVTEEAIEQGELSGETAGKKKKQQKDPNRGRFLPIPIFITEPAIGEGLGLALAYFHRAKETPEETAIASPGSIGNTSREQTPPPTVSGVFGAYTSNETAAVGAGHMNTFKDDHIRFTAVAAYADVNSTFYVLDQPFKFNLEGVLAYQETRVRFGDSQWFWGIGLSYLDASNVFEVDIPEDAPIELFRTEFRNTGISAKLAWDTRDNTSMPNRGQLFDLSVWRYDESFSGDFDYWDARLKLLSFHQLNDKFVLGLRLEYSTIEGRAPFFAIPWVSLRGIPALRYQGDRVAVAEVEVRYNLSPRWALIGFAGSGAVANDIPALDTEQSIYAYGLGGRFNIFQAQNIWVGIDVAKGPEERAWYIQVGHAW
jgi:hypothetical protein